jgi:hypothetical protein
MPNRRFDWHEHIKDIEGEYRAARIAVNRLKAEVVAAPDLLRNDDRTRAYLRDADRNLEGTYWFASSPRSRRRSALMIGHVTTTRTVPRMHRC